MNLTKEQLNTLPKIELHVHLDGSILPETLIELANVQGAALPTYDPQLLLSYMSAPEHCQSLNDYLRTFDFVLPFVQSYEAIERVAYELVQQCAAHAVQYVEVRYAPQLHRQQGLTVSETYEAVIEGLQRGEKQFGVISRCIGICLRGHSEEQNIEVVEEAARFLNKGLVAVDLAGAEAIYPPQLYVNVFQRAKQLQLPITIHAGEAAGAESIEVAIKQLGASRIGHGVRLQEDPQLFAEIVRLGIPLEFCPISNLQTKAVEAWDQYPIKQYMEQGIAVTVNTDNLTVSQTTLTKELMSVQQQCGITVEQIIQLQRNALNAILLEQPSKTSFQKLYHSLLDSWLEKNYA